MKKTTIILKSLNIPNNLFFIGSDAEIEAAEAREEARAEELKKIFFNPSFLAAEYITTYGARHILHHSTRDGVLFQLSYIAADGVPTMHENFIKTDGKNPFYIGGADELTRHYINACSQKDIFLTVLTA